MLFYKVGPSPKKWWGMLMTSIDGGRSWTVARRLPEEIYGPIKNKPVELSNGDILCPSSEEVKYNPRKPSRWRVHFERTGDFGNTWERSGVLNARAIQAIQPSILFLGRNKLLAVGRTRQNRLFEVVSKNGGKTWGSMKLHILPNPNSATDAVTLRDGRHILVYNHVRKDSGQWDGPRTPLNVAISNNGREWWAALVLENSPGEYSYPAVIQTADGMVHITYTWNRRRIRHVVLDPACLKPEPFLRGKWPTWIKTKKVLK